MNTQLLSNLLNEDVARTVIIQLGGKGKEGLGKFIIDSLPLVTFENVLAWKMLLDYVGSNDRIRKGISEFISTFPSMNIPVLLLFCRECDPNTLEELFFESARRNIPDYIVLLLEYLSELGVTYTWNQLFRDLHDKGENDSIKNIMLASGHSYDVFLNEFDETLNGNKEFVDLIFSTFNLSELPHEELRKLGNNAVSSEIRERATQAHNETFTLDLEDEEIPDPFDPEFGVEYNEALHTSYFECNDIESRQCYSIATLSERRKSCRIPVEEDELEMEADIIAKYGPLNSMINGGCEKYGGCRMYSCECVNKKWYRKKCESCDEDIPTMYEAVRIPLINGGWRGCFCSEDCFTGIHKKKDQKRWIKILSLNE